MRLTMTSLAALAIFGAPVSAHQRAAKAHAAKAPAPAASGAAATVEAFHAALHRGDARAAAALLADDALIFEAGGAERSKAEYQAMHLPADIAFSRAVSSVVKRRGGTSAGAFAWVASEGEMTGTYKGKPVAELTTETMILRRDGGAWKIVHIHWSSAARR
jgi:ketosteroid isomerase-like protein